jgi:hypothetical protein
MPASIAGIGDAMAQPGSRADVSCKLLVKI